MRCVMVMFDSLNRRCLPCYPGTDYDWIKAPNFARLAQKSVTFDTSYVCSMPCMPARRDLHTGRPNFLHTPWSPLQPFDDSMPELLKEAGTHTHIDTDHYHYFEDGGATYHNRYTTWQSFRGQEGDFFHGHVGPVDIPANHNGKGKWNDQDWRNRTVIRDDSDYPQTQTFRAGLDFIERNADQDNWMLQIETFDPHEPFTSNRQWRDLYPKDDEGVDLLDWPAYGRDGYTEGQRKAAQRNYAALLTKCDASLGNVLDAFDRHDLWKDTMLVVWTDHGYMLGEHGWMAKNMPPMYDEISRTPFFVYDPRCPETAGMRRESLVQPSIDIPVTLLNYFGQDVPKDMTGKDLAPVIKDDTSVRDTAIFGYFGQDLNITDGRYVYMIPPVDDAPNSEIYTLMPTQMRGFRTDVHNAELVEPMPFTKNMPLLRTLGGQHSLGNQRDNGLPQNLLFDTQNDPGQHTPTEDDAVETRLREAAVQLMAQVHAPANQFKRFGLATTTA